MASNLDNFAVDEGAFHLKNLLDGVLARVVSIYESYGVPLPMRRYWTMGTPAEDCEQLVVSFVQAYMGLPGDEASRPQKCNMPKSAVMTISLTRSIPVVGPNGKAPSGDSIQKAAGVSAVDSWVLLDSLRLLDQWDDDYISGPGVIATVNVPDPQGGFQTVNMQVTMVIP
jgi:hypothetical protein